MKEWKDMNKEERKEWKLKRMMERYCDCEYPVDCEIRGYYDNGATGWECDECDKEIYFEIDTDEYSCSLGDVYFIRASDIPKKVGLWQYM
jgi:hypothetical protein